MRCIMRNRGYFLLILIGLWLFFSNILYSKNEPQPSIKKGATAYWPGLHWQTDDFSLRLQQVKLSPLPHKPLALQLTVRQLTVNYLGLEFVLQGLCLNLRLDDKMQGIEIDQHLNSVILPVFLLQGQPAQLQQSMQLFLQPQQLNFHQLLIQRLTIHNFQLQNQAIRVTAQAEFMPFDFSQPQFNGQVDIKMDAPPGSVYLPWLQRGLQTGYWQQQAGSYHSHLNFNQNLPHINNAHVH